MPSNETTSRRDFDYAVVTLAQLRDLRSFEELEKVIDRTLDPAARSYLHNYFAAVNDDGSLSYNRAVSTHARVVTSFDQSLNHPWVARIRNLGRNENGQLTLPRELGYGGRLKEKNAALAAVLGYRGLPMLVESGDFVPPPLRAAVALHIDKGLLSIRKNLKAGPSQRRWDDLVMTAKGRPEAEYQLSVMASMDATGLGGPNARGVVEMSSHSYSPVYLDGIDQQVLHALSAAESPLTLKDLSRCTRRPVSQVWASAQKLDESSLVDLQGKANLLRLAITDVGAEVDLAMAGDESSPSRVRSLSIDRPLLRLGQSSIDELKAAAQSVNGVQKRKGILRAEWMDQTHQPRANARGVDELAQRIMDRLDKEADSASQALRLASNDVATKLLGIFKSDAPVNAGNNAYLIGTLKSDQPKNAVRLVCLRNLKGVWVINDTAVLDAGLGSKDAVAVYVDTWEGTFEAQPAGPEIRQAFVADMAALHVEMHGLARPTSALVWEIG